MRYILICLLFLSSAGAMPKRDRHPKKSDNYHRKVTRTRTYEEDIRSGEEKEVVPKKKKSKKVKKVLTTIFTLGLSALFGVCK